MTLPDEDLREFFDIARAAEAADRWPLLARFWKTLGGESLAPRPAATKLYAPPSSPVDSARAPRPVVHAQEPGDRTSDRTETRPANEKTDTSDAALSLEELFGRLR